MAVAKRPDLKGNMSLETCASEILDVIVDKSDELIFTDWEADTLDDRSLMYACTDADLVFQINKVLSEDSGTSAHDDGGDGDDDTRPPVDLADALGAPRGDADDPMDDDAGSMINDSNEAQNVADEPAGAKNLDDDADETIDAEDLTWNAKKVLQDILHLIQRYDRNVSTKHVLHSAFMAALRDAIFVCNQDEIDAVVEQLRKRGVARDEIYRIRRRYYTRTGRVRRSVPPPNELAERVKAVVLLFKLVSANDKDPLFLKGFDDAHASQMKLIKDGFVSDPPNVNMYILLKCEASGLPVFKCIRGTTALEGFHRHLRAAVQTCLASPQLVEAIISEVGRILLLGAIVLV